MSRAFADPYYQRYRYRPDCRLHRRQATPTLTPPTSDDRQRCTDTSIAGHHRAAVVMVIALVASTLALSCPS